MLGRVPGRRPGLQLGGITRRGHRRCGRAENDYENEERERWEAGAEGRAVGARLTPSIRVYFGSIGDSMTSIPFRQ